MRGIGLLLLRLSNSSGTSLPGSNKLTPSKISTRRVPSTILLFFQDASEDLLEENLTLAPKVVQKHRETYFRSKQADPFKISAQRMTYSILLSSDAVEDLLEKNLTLAPKLSESAGRPMFALRKVTLSKIIVE